MIAHALLFMLAPEDAVTSATARYSNCVVDAVAQDVGVPHAELRAGTQPLLVVRNAVQHCSAERNALAQAIGDQVLSDNSVPSDARRVEAQNRFGMAELPILLALVRRDDLRSTQ